MSSVTILIMTAIHLCMAGALQTWVSKDEKKRGRDRLEGIISFEHFLLCLFFFFSYLCFLCGVSNGSADRKRQTPTL